MRIFFLLITLTIGFSLTSVGQKKSNLSKKEQKEKQQMQESESLNNLKKVLNGKSWILKVNSLNTMEGETYFFSPNSNFVTIENDLSTIELPLSEFVQSGSTNFLGLQVNADITMYSFPENKDNKPIWGNIQFICDQLDWIKMTFNISWNGDTTIQYSQSDGVTFTLSGVIEEIQN